MNGPSEAKLVKALIGRRRPAILYHYTSASGLIGMLQSKSIWTTDILFLNDATEYEFALRLARDVIERRLKETRNNFDFGLYTVLQDRLMHEAGGDVYVTSFTENPDQLSQWRAYCPPSGGYAIGFRSKFLVPHNGANANCFLTRCLYDWKGEELIRDLIQVVVRFAEEQLHAHLEHDRIFRESFKLLGRLLPLVAPALKDPSFVEEDEWRLVRLPGSFDKPTRFRAGRSTVVPYHEYSLQDEKGKVPITEVIVGPTPHPRLARGAVEALLSASGIQSASVKLSSIPYRAW